MRDLLQVGASEVEVRLEDLRQESDDAAKKFAAYLTHYPTKSSRSRHGLLGPVAEVVKLATKPLMTAGQATGRALRMHEMAQEGRRVSPQATKTLEEAVSAFFALMKRCPVHIRKTVSDRVLDQVYLLARKAEQTFWADWNDWCRKAYKTVEMLSEAWGTSFESWEKVRFTKASASDRAKSDFEQFKQARKAAGEAVPETDDADEY